VEWRIKLHWRGGVGEVSGISEGNKIAGSRKNKSFKEVKKRCQVMLLLRNAMAAKGRIRRHVCISAPTI